MTRLNGFRWWGDRACRFVILLNPFFLISKIKQFFPVSSFQFKVLLSKVHPSILFCFQIILGQRTLTVWEEYHYTTVSYHCNGRAFKAWIKLHVHTFSYLVKLETSSTVILPPTCNQKLKQLLIWCTSLLLNLMVRRTTSKNKSALYELSFLNGPNPASFCLFSFFSHITWTNRAQIWL